MPRSCIRAALYHYPPLSELKSYTEPVYLVNFHSHYSMKQQIGECCWFQVSIDDTNHHFTSLADLSSTLKCCPPQYPSSGPINVIAALWWLITMLILLQHISSRHIPQVSFPCSLFGPLSAGFGSHHQGAIVKHVFDILLQ
jgi:hypothetical protein